MFNTISSYFFGSSAPQEEEEETAMETAANPPNTTPQQADRPCRLKETHTEEEWVLVDKSSREGSPDRYVASTNSSASSTPEFVHPASWRRPHTTTTTIGLAGHGGDTSGDSDIGSDISTLPDNACSGETWLVTPPPCFTAGGSSLERMEQHPMENLLIEHPSMSVYGPRLRQNSAGVESDLSESSNEESSNCNNSRHIVTRSRVALVRSSPRRPRAVAARAGLATTNQQQTVKAAQVGQRRNNKRQLSAKELSRSNKVRQVESRGVRQRQKSLLMQPGSRSSCKRC